MLVRAWVVWAALSLLVPVFFNRVYHDAPITLPDMLVGVGLALFPLLIYGVYRFVRGKP